MSKNNTRCLWLRLLVLVFPLTFSWLIVSKFLFQLILTSSFIPIGDIESMESKNTETISKCKSTPLYCNCFELHISNRLQTLHPQDSLTHGTKMIPFLAPFLTTGSLSIPTQRLFFLLCYNPPFSLSTDVDSVFWFR